MEIEKSPSTRPIAEIAKVALTATQALTTTRKKTRPESSGGSPKIGNSWTDKWLGLKPWHPEILRLSSSVGKFCRDWFRGEAPYVLVLAGPSGCGKTHAMKGANRWANHARVTAADLKYWRRPATIQWTQWPELIRAIVENSIPMADGLSDSIEADILFLDDIGAESDKFRSAETTDALCQLLSRRERKWTLLSTNFQPETWATKFDVRVSDRLLRNSVLCDINCGSYCMQV